MAIAIIGWGSLIWDPRHLRLVGPWQIGGPRLPLEFSRISRDGRLTLVIDHQHGAPVETYYVASSWRHLDDAVADLGMRENTRYIGFVTAKDQRTPAEADRYNKKTYEKISVWLQQTHFEAAVWTALTSNFRRKTGRSFSVENAVMYLKDLPQSVRDAALEYIRKAPVQVDTPLRRQLAELGWA